MGHTRKKEDGGRKLEQYDRRLTAETFLVIFYRSDKLNIAPLSSHITGVGSGERIAEDCRSSLSFDEFPQERAKQI